MRCPVSGRAVSTMESSVDICLTERLSMRLPIISTLPESGGSSPESVRSSVLLPAPFTPMRHVRLAGGRAAQRFEATVRRCRPVP